jgi:hypothetical protein
VTLVSPLDTHIIAKCGNSKNELPDSWRPRTGLFWQYVAIFLSFALLDTQDHALAVDGGRCERNGLGDAQAGGVAGGRSRWRDVSGSRRGQETERLLLD